MSTLAKVSPNKFPSASTVPTPKSHGDHPRTGVTKARVTLTVDKVLLPYIRRIASAHGGLSAFASECFADYAAKDEEAKARLSAQPSPPTQPA
jgi:hypothetical protein